MTKRTLLGVCLAVGSLLIVWGFLDDPILGGGLGFGGLQLLVVAIGVVTILAGFLPTAFAQQYLLTLGSLAVALLAAEAILQYQYAPSYYTAYEQDERALFKLRPGAVRDYKHLKVNGGNTITFRVNSDGFRGPELKPRGEQLRIAVYGDSFIQAEFTPQQETFTAQLQKSLATKLGRSVEVVNAGVAGYGPDQILRRIQTELDKLRPHLVIVSIFSGNDFGDLLRNRLYRLNESGQLVENQFRIDETTQRQMLLNKYEPISRKIFSNLLKGQNTAQSAEPKFDPAAWVMSAMQQQKAEYTSFIINGDNTVGNFGVDKYSTDIALEPDSDAARYQVRVMGAVLKAMSQLSREKSIPLAIINIPHPMDLLNGTHSSGFIDKAKFPAYQSRRLTDLVQTLAGAAGLPQLNLYPVFKATDVNQHFFKGGDDHWNSLGQKLAANATTEFLIANQLVK